MDNSYAVPCLKPYEEWEKLNRNERNHTASNGSNSSACCTFRMGKSSVWTTTNSRNSLSLKKKINKLLKCKHWFEKKKRSRVFLGNHHWTFDSIWFVLIWFDLVENFKSNFCFGILFLIIFYVVKHTFFNAIIDHSWTVTYENMKTFGVLWRVMLIRINFCFGILFLMFYVVKHMFFKAISRLIWILLSSQWPVTIEFFLWTV